MERPITTNQQLNSFMENVVLPHAQAISKLRVCNENSLMEIREMEDENTFERLSEMYYLNH